LARGVLVRNVGIPGTLRITAGTEAETTKLLAELALVLG
jgi:histidinol-phosphate aminotransferase